MADTNNQRRLRIVFMGTPVFGVRPLTTLRETEDVVLVVTQPDRRAGRRQILTPSPVKEEAERLKLPVFQPEKIKDAEAVRVLRETSCDLIVVAAFGQILSREILSIPERGCINIHASLLPKYRGASPIAAAIAHGERVTGITTAMMDAGMDTGDILLQRSLEIGEQETAGSLSERLSSLGAECILETMKELKTGRLQPRPQAHSEASYTLLLKKHDGRIDWDREPVEIERFVRAMHPWPGAFTEAHGQRLRIFRVTPHGDQGGPGEVLCARGRLIVAARGGSLIIEELQLAGKKRVSGPEFLRGHHELQEGMILGA